MSTHGSAFKVLSKGPLRTSAQKALRYLYWVPLLRFLEAPKITSGRVLGFLQSRRSPKEDALRCLFEEPVIGL